MSNTNGHLSTESQFSVFLPSKPGALAHVVQALADSSINLVALSLMDSTEHGVLRLVTDTPDRVRAALSKLQVSFTDTPVLLATLPNRPGALADVVERLASEHINVTYAYCTTGARNGKTNGVFKVSDVPKAMKVLGGGRTPKRKSKKVVRQSPAKITRR